MRCPTCQQITFYSGNPFRPFCSGRCKLIDLGKWAADAYRLPTDEQTPAWSENDEPSRDRRDH